MARRRGELQRARDAYALRDQGLTLAKIAQALGFRHASAARKAAQRGEKLANVDAQSKRRGTVETRAQVAPEKNVWLDVYAAPSTGIDFGNRLTADIYQRPVRW